MATRKEFRLAITAVIALLSVLALVGVGRFNMPRQSGGDPTGVQLARAQLLASPSSDTALMCRFGFGSGISPVTDFDLPQVASLRAGWYLDFTADDAPTPNGMSYAPMIRGRQLKTVTPSYTATYVFPYTYTMYPTLDWIQGVGISLLAKGSTWMVANEPERRDWYDPCCGSLGQDEMLPEVYATFFHDAYQVIKAGDPTAQVAVAGLVEVTPLRLEYLNRVLQSYRDQYGIDLPADAWTMHPYADSEIRGGIGADIPAGLTATIGVTYPLYANADANLLKTQVVSMREWMNSHRQGRKPLLISEFGVQIPADYVDENGQSFATPRVQQYMYDSFDWLLTATDATLGDPADDNHLVQAWNWFSLAHDPRQTNGSLFSMTTRMIDELGLDWAGYVNDANRNFGLNVNFKLLYGAYAVGEPDSSGLATATVQLHLSNSGNRNFTGDVPVRVVQLTGGAYSQTLTAPGVRGCGGTTVVAFVIPNLPVASLWSFQATIDPDNLTGDQNPADNSLTFTLLVPTAQLWLPGLSQ